MLKGNFNQPKEKMKLPSQGREPRHLGTKKPSQNFLQKFAKDQASFRS